MNLFENAKFFMVKENLTDGILKKYISYDGVL